ncbi:hypothetical protein G3489_19685 [Shewanella baltica]|uniref:hypothetical protein n=1 Tax=Shewanella baltica TaxID=62322 RepID=UPI00217DBA6A|nr:hypothetical protein [Shewanella baltica]MCS6271900.1 hypothetical protein [Shewanella baltica]
MRIYVSPKNENRWILQPFRVVVKGAGREERLRLIAKANEFRYLNVFPLRDELHAAYTVEKNGFDFAARLLTYCNTSGIADLIYVERNNDDHNIIVFIKNGLIKQDKVGKKADIERVIDTIIDSGDVDEVRVVNYQFLDSSFYEKVKVAFSGKIENVSAALTDKLEPSEIFAFLPEREAMSKVKSRRPWVLYAGIFLVCVLTVGKLFSLTPDESESEIVVDPYSSFFEGMQTDTVQVLNRMAQDYNIHVGLLTLPGWVVDRVNITKGQASYRMLPEENGDIKTLTEFAKKNDLHLLINPNEIVLLGYGANIPALNDEYVKMYDVESVHHFIRDAVNEYIPGGQISFIRDVPKGVEQKWVIRELMFEFRGIYKEDLMTLGAITKNLPISLGGDSLDPNAGQYIVDKERLTGGIKISVFGDK